MLILDDRLLVGDRLLVRDGLLVGEGLLVGDSGAGLFEVGDGLPARDDRVDGSLIVDKDGAMVRSLISCTCWDGLVTL